LALQRDKHDKGHNQREKHYGGLVHIEPDTFDVTEESQPFMPA
jgi:hypothetical protein